jgi:hypothetical protein
MDGLLRGKGRMDYKRRQKAKCQHPEDMLLKRISHNVIVLKFTGFG